MKRSLYTVLPALLLALILPFAISGTMDMHAVTPVENLSPAASPAYPVGTDALITADHMPGMKGAVARISGAFDTVLYAINYTRSDTAEVIKDHRWVIQEEIEGHGEVPYKAGDEVTLLPGHISGMGGEGVQAKIAEVMPGVAYMVDFTPGDGTQRVLNHQWLSQEELLPYGTLAGSPGCD